MKTTVLSQVFTALLLTSSAIAHPGDSPEEKAREAAARRDYLSVNKGSLAHCAETLKARGLHAAMHKRREAAVEVLRAKRGLATGTIKTERRYRIVLRYYQRDLTFALEMIAQCSTKAISRT